MLKDKFVNREHRNNHGAHPHDEHHRVHHECHGVQTIEREPHRVQDVARREEVARKRLVFPIHFVSLPYE